MGRINHLKEFLKETNKTLKEVLFVTDEGTNIKCFVNAIPVATGVREALSYERQYNEKAMEDDECVSILRSGLARYILDAFDILNSNDSELLGDYYDDNEVYTAVEEGIIETISSKNNLENLTNSLFRGIKGELEKLDKIIN